MRALGLGLTLLSSTALAYWAPDHVKLNKQVFCKGKPWGDAGFKRGGRTVVSTLDYARSVLYLTRPGKCGDAASDDALRLRGVKFKEAITWLPGPDVAPGLETPTDEPNASYTLQEWNAQGGLWEDGFNTFSEATKWGGRRAVNHFHDPLTPGGGYTGLTSTDVATSVAYVDLLRRGISATEWVKNGTSGGDLGKNLWGYPTIGESLHRAFTEKKNEKRQSGLACAFRAMGQVEHLVEDNTVPDHTRDLAHPGDGWEEFMNGFGAPLFSHYTGGAWVSFPVRQIEANGLRALWDRDVYGETPEPTWSPVGDPPGLSEYVNANFLAWNVFTKPGIPIDFSTVPDEPGEPFTRGWRLGVGSAEIKVPGSLLGIRTNSVTYPWPRLGTFTDPVYASAPRTEPLPVIAREKVGGGKGIDDQAWNYYRKPLISRALGYAQSVVSLALQPARAEVVPSPDGDPLALRVRLWNLWEPGSPNAVTWHVTKVQLVTVRKDKDQAIPFADEEPLTVFTPGMDVAPGTKVETPELTITWPQRGPYRYASHSAVLVTATIGSGNAKTPLVFAIPIVNALVWIKQTAGVDLTGTYDNVTQNCSTGSCSYSGENGKYWNPEHHRVTGTIELSPAEVDIFGRPADAELKAVQKEDAHVAGVALFGLSRVGSLQPVRINQSSLTLSGASQLEPTSIPGVFLRKADAPDTADGPIDFVADLHSQDFDVPDIDPVADAHRASGSIYLAVWTTAGAVQLQRLVVWPWLHPNTAQSIVQPQSCDVFSSWRGINEARGDCSHGGTSNMGVCTNSTYHRQISAIVFGDMGISRAVIEQGAQIPSFIHAFGFSNDIRVTSFMGFPVQLAANDTQVPVPVTQLPTFYPEGQGEAVIPYFAPGGVAYFFANSSSGNGQCSGSPQPPMKPLTAEYKRIFPPAMQMGLKRDFGITTPAEWTFSLSAQ